MEPLNLLLIAAKNKPSYCDQCTFCATLLYIYVNLINITKFIMLQDSEHFLIRLYPKIKYQLRN